MPGNQANLGFWTAPPKRLSQAGDWFYPGEIAKAGVNVEKKAQRDKFHQKFVPFFQVDGTPYCPVRYYRIKQGHKPNHHLRGKGTNMNRMLYSDMLKDINRARESGGNVAACIDSFREKIQIRVCLQRLLLQKNFWRYRKYEHGGKFF